MMARQIRGKESEVRRRIVVLGTVAVMCAVAVAAVSGLARGSDATTYLVVYKGTAVPANAASSIQQAGGSLAYSYGQIGVAVAQSTDPSFATNALNDSRVQGASATGQ